MNPSKTELRTHLKLLLKENSALLAEKSHLLCQALQQHPHWLEASTIAIFAPLPNEPNLLPLCPCPHKRFVFPKISGQCLLWFVVDHPQTQLARSPEGTLRLLEPNTQNHCTLSEIDLILVPGLAFSENGLRLGRGRGFYDRALSIKSPATKTMGVCFDFQLCNNIPIEAHDHPVDTVLFA